jgi:hypothetical protein
MSINDENCESLLSSHDVDEKFNKNFKQHVKNS